MLQRIRAAAVLLIAGALLVLPRLAVAADTLQIVRPIDLTALPLLVMEHEHLIERTADSMGISGLKITWTAPDKTDPLAALAAGQTDLAMADTAPFLAAADNGAGTPSAIVALGAVAQRPYVLLTRNPAIHTILDFTAADRIAVPDTRLSGPALMLEMAAAAEWGPEHYDKLDRLMVARDDNAAMTALLSPKGDPKGDPRGDIDSHFSRTPYADTELGDPAIHRVMDSFDIAGPHTIAVLAVSSGFAAANGELCKAILSALQAADDFIRKTPGAAAEIFAGAIKGQDVSLEDLSDMIGDPDTAYVAAPAGMTRLVQFMQRIGRLRHPPPQSWRELFLAAARDLPGS